MINTYRFTMPTQQRALELGYKVEGQCQRTRLWLMGVAFALPAIQSNIVFTVNKVGKENRSGFIEFSTDSIPLFHEIWEKWKPYGITCTQIGGIINGVDITEKKSVEIK